MISAWWLLLICPVCGAIGVLTVALLIAGKTEDDR
jgi:hypothetical protein